MGAESSLLHVCEVQDIYLTPQCTGFFLIERLGENISEIVFGLNMIDDNILSSNMIGNEMMSDGNMLHARMLHRIMCNFDSTLIITIKRYMLDLDAIILRVYFIHNNSVQQDPAAVYSASAVDRDTQFCFLEDQRTKDLPRK